VHANNGSFLAAMAAEGFGIAYEPDFIVGPHLAAGRLVRVLAEWQLPASPIYVAYASRRHVSAKVRAFTDHMADAFRTADWMIDAPGRRTAP
jgi:DNA-binding transcriptional LysR family regulator